MIFSHRYLESNGINVKTFVFLSVYFWNRPPTMLKNFFKCMTDICKFSRCPWNFFMQIVSDRRISGKFYISLNCFEFNNVIQVCHNDLLFQVTMSSFPFKIPMMFFFLLFLQMSDTTFKNTPTHMYTEAVKIETYHFFRATPTKIHCIKIKNICTQISFNTP